MLRYPLRWLLLCLLGPATLVAQHPATLTNQELRDWIEENTYDGNYAVIDYADSIEQRALREPNTSLAVRLLTSLGDALRANSYGYSTDAGLSVHRLALDRLRRADDTLSQATLHLKIASVLFNMRRTYEGETEIFRAIDLYRQLADSSGIVAGQRHLCDFCRTAGEYEEALDYARSATAYYRRTNEAFNADFAQLCELITYLHMGEPAAAIRLADEMLERRGKTFDNNYGNSTFILTVRRDALLQTGDTTAAIQTTRRLLESHAYDGRSIGDNPWYDAEEGYLYALLDRPKRAIPPLRSFFR